jgi:hypothetical protein
VQSILSLPTIRRGEGADITKIHDFDENLIFSVNGYVRATLDKPEAIRGDPVVRTDDKWQSWKFQHLIESLRKRTQINSIKQADREDDKEQIERRRHGRYYQTKNEEWKPRPCVEWESDQH